MRWTVIIPAKALSGAKSRLAPASTDTDAHQRLVAAIRADTIAAARAARGVARVLVVIDRPETALELPDGVEVVVQRTAGLNPALREAAEHAGANWPADGVAALVGDLPAVRPDELATTLAAAATRPAGFVPDAEGTGTTLLTARPGTALQPAFGPGSAGRHAVQAAPLAAGPGLRRDVDTARDLAEASALGVGPATLAALTRNGLTAHSP